MPDQFRRYTADRFRNEVRAESATYRHPESFFPFTSLLLFFILTLPSFSQRTAGDEANIQPHFIIDTPIAGLLPDRVGEAGLYFYPEGGTLLNLSFGLGEKFNFGLSFGGTNLVGSGKVDWNKLPAIMVRYRLFEEQSITPALLVGFDSQGKDGYQEEWRQYTIKSPGFFLSVSKNYKLYGILSFHSALTYSLERRDGDKAPNVFIGMEKSIGSSVSFLSEYNFCFDSDNDEKGFWNGMLNVGLRISTAFGINIDVYFKNLLTNKFYYPHLYRALRIQYVRQF